MEQSLKVMARLEDYNYRNFDSNWESFDFSIQEKFSIKIALKLIPTDTVFLAFGDNFSKVSIKNLVTDKPASITVAIE